MDCPPHRLRGAGHALPIIQSQSVKSCLSLHSHIFRKLCSMNVWSVNLSLQRATNDTASSQWVCCPVLGSCMLAYHDPDCPKLGCCHAHLTGNQLSVQHTAVESPATVFL